MSRRIILTALAVSVAAPASAATYTLNVVPTAGQASRYDRGTTIIDSVQRSTTVRVIEVPSVDKNTVSFIIGVLNSGDRSFVFGPDNVVVREAGAKPLPLLTYEQAMEAERKKEKHEEFWAGVHAFGRKLSAASAGTTYGSGTYSGSDGSGTFSYSETNSAMQLAAQREAADMNRQDRADLEAKWAERGASYDTLLRPTTVDPGAVYGGIVTFTISKELQKAKQPVQLNIEVNVAGEAHGFVGRLSVID